MTAPRKPAPSAARKAAAAEAYARRTMPSEVDPAFDEEFRGTDADDAAVVDRIRNGREGAAEWGLL